MLLYLAGTELAWRNSNYWLDFEKGQKILTSYYYARKFSDNMINKILSCIGGPENLLLDSGAFTFRFHKDNRENIEKYTEQYIEFINKWNIKYFFEMDIDNTLEELPQVLKLREQIEQGTGKKSIPVWHLNRGIQHWKDIVERYDYIAIGGITSSLEPQYEKTIKQMVKYANSKNTKVHGLGYIRKNVLEFGFYSVDATSWNAGQYGGIWHFNREDGYPKRRNRDLKHRIKTDKQSDLAKHNFKVWTQYQKYLLDKGYWRQ